MPLLDIAIAHSSFLKHSDYTRVLLFISGNTPNYSLLQHEERWASLRKSLQNNRNLKCGLIHLKKSCPGFLVSAVATLEPQCIVQNKDREKECNALSSTEASKSETVRTESSTGDSEEIDEREKLRRLRISQANKGNTPWNKGRRHSPETLRRIKERTRLAMQSPKVKLKLANMGHAQSTETRVKIAVGVRMGWQKRREKLILQETCLFDWQNLVAESAREGFQDEEELQWDSYDILSKKFQQEWLDAIERRKTMPRVVRGSKRAPKSLEQRKKIAEAIAAKWADPEYRSRVQSGLAKYHGIPEGAERKAKKKPTGEDSSSTSRKNSYMDRLGVSGRTQLPKPKKRNIPKYKDPLAEAKLEMLKSIRAERVASETKKVEALERAKLLIAEAQKAAKALEIAAMQSPVARASLIEAQKLIAEATQSIESIENGDPSSQNDVKSEHQDYVERGGETLSEDVLDYHIGVNGIKETIPANAGQRYYKMVNGDSGIIAETTDQTHHTLVNGVESLQLGIESLQLSEGLNLDTDLFKLTIVDEVDQKLERDSVEENLDLKESMNKQYPDANGYLGLNACSSINGVKFQTVEDHELPAVKTVSKKWVRGRLIEVEEGE